MSHRRGQRKRVHTRRWHVGAISAAQVLHAGRRAHRRIGCTASAYRSAPSASAADSGLHAAPATARTGRAAARAAKAASHVRTHPVQSRGLGSNGARGVNIAILEASYFSWLGTI